LGVGGGSKLIDAPPGAPVGAKVLNAHCPNELKEITAKAATKTVEVKILLMTIKFKFKRFGYTAISRRNWEGFSKGILDYCCW
jgi:hypothetical protein